MTIQVLETDRGKRLDSLLHERLPEFSRSRLQTWIRGGRVLVDGQTAKSSAVVRGAEVIVVDPGSCRRFGLPRRIFRLPCSMRMTARS